MKSSFAKTSRGKKFLLPALIFMGLLYLGLEFLHKYQTAREPEYSKLRADSHGTAGHGYHGAAAVLDKLGLKIERSTFPPPTSLQTGDTIMIIEPSQSTLTNWQVPVKELLEWARTNRGNVVLVNDLRFALGSLDKTNRLKEFLGVAGLRARIAEANDFTTVPVTFADNWITDMYYDEEMVYGAVPVQGTGAFKTVTGLANLCVDPNAISVFDLSSVECRESSTLQLVQKGEVTSHTLAVRYSLGNGSLTLVSDAQMFTNALLRYEDNSVLLAAISSGGSGRVVFDEFYHNLMPRSAAYLLGLPGYALTLAAMLLTTALWVWRIGLRLGPPLADRLVQRRTITEYLEGIGNLFLRKKKFHFLLEELYTGALWALRRELRLPPNQDSIQDLVVAMERHDPKRAALVGKNLVAVRALLQQPRISEKNYIHAAKEINQCL